MWRIGDGQAPSGPANIRPDNSEVARRLKTPFVVARPAGHRRDEASSGIARRDAPGGARRGALSGR
jgi:hypothetical protein